MHYILLMANIELKLFERKEYKMNGATNLSVNDFLKKY